jgi:phosphoribosylformimino-5-aminoimidazole carboxamide ribotide isomerase
MLIPSIDLERGRIVQLVQGERLAVESTDVDGWIRKFAHFPLVQVIDLDAARGDGHNRDLVAAIAGQLPCQVGGGVRSTGDAVAMLAAGAQRVIIGSVLFDAHGVNVAIAEAFASALGAERVVAAVDSRGGSIVVRGWRATVAMTPIEAIERLNPWVGGFLATLVDGEGLMGGIDFAAVRALRAAAARRLIVAGGIRSLDEIRALDAEGIDAVVGMAIYTGAIDPEHAR